MAYKAFNIYFFKSISIDNFLFEKGKKTDEVVSSDACYLILLNF